MRTSLTIILFLILSVFLIIPNPAHASVEDSIKACVMIETYCGDMVSKGSGFLVSSDGLIVTNAHVVISNEINVKLMIGSMEQTVPATCVYWNDGIDLAVLKIAFGGLPYLKFGTMSSMHIGQPLYSIGFPLDFIDPIVSDGIYSSFNKETNKIQHTAEIYPGNSGGPLIDADGTVYGVNTLIMEYNVSSLFFLAIPCDLTKSVVDGVQSEQAAGRMGEVTVQCNPTNSVSNTPSDGLFDLEYVDGLYNNYPEGLNVAYDLEMTFSFYIPDKYTFYDSSEEDFANYGLTCLVKYENLDDPYYYAVPAMDIYVSMPSQKKKEFISARKSYLTDLGYEEVNAGDVAEIKSILSDLGITSEIYQFVIEDTSGNNLDVEILSFYLEDSDTHRMAWMDSVYYYTDDYDTITTGILGLVLSSFMFEE